MNDYQNYVDGNFVPSGSGRRITVSNPSTGKSICTVPDSDESDVGAALTVAADAQKKWARTPAIERARVLHAIASAIRKNVEIIAKIITEEQGKILDLARVEVAFAAEYFDYMAEWARRIEGEIVESDRSGELILLFRKPIGVVAGILPWNFPFFLIARKTAPALVTGNAIVLKPSEETPHNAVKFCELLAEAGVPNGLINVVHGRGGSAGRALCNSPITDMITFTGSIEAGSNVMQTAARNITKVNLELGGKAPAIVMSDCDLDLAVKSVCASRVINSGQVCNCAERVYVDSKIENEFLDKLVSAMSSVKYGDPLSDTKVEYGPLINESGFRKVEQLVTEAIGSGASILTGGKRGHGDGGYFYEPTVVANCKQNMPIVQKEIFGPVIPVVRFDGIDEAITLANQSEYGLTSSVYTRNLNTALKVCRELRFGETYINRENFEAMQGFHAGWRKSGIGGADGKHGLYEFLQTHTVYLQSA